MLVLVISIFLFSLKSEINPDMVYKPISTIPCQSLITIEWNNTAPWERLFLNQYILELDLIEQFRKPYTHIWVISDSDIIFMSRVLANPQQQTFPVFRLNVLDSLVWG